PARAGLRPGVRRPGAPRLDALRRGARRPRQRRGLGGEELNHRDTEDTEKTKKRDKENNTKRRLFGSRLSSFSMFFSLFCLLCVLCVSVVEIRVSVVQSLFNSKVNVFLPSLTVALRGVVSGLRYFSGTVSGRGLPGVSTSEKPGSMVTAYSPAGAPSPAR